MSFPVVLVLRGNPADGDSRPEPWAHCHNPFEHASSAISGLQAGHLYSPFHFYAMEQPLALTKNSTDTPRSSFLSSLGPTERQQVGYQCCKVAGEQNYCI